MNRQHARLSVKKTSTPQSDEIACFTAIALLLSYLFSHPVPIRIRNTGLQTRRLLLICRLSWLWGLIARALPETTSLASSTHQHTLLISHPDLHMYTRQANSIHDPRHTMAVERIRRRKGRIVEGELQAAERQPQEGGGQASYHQGGRGGRPSTSLLLSGAGGRGMLAVVLLLTARSTEGFHFSSVSRAVCGSAAHTPMDGGVTGGLGGARGGIHSSDRSSAGTGVCRGGSPPISQGGVGTGGKWLAAGPSLSRGGVMNHLIPARFRWGEAWDEDLSLLSSSSLLSPSSLSSSSGSSTVSSSLLSSLLAAVVGVEEEKGLIPSLIPAGMGPLTYSSSSSSSSSNCNGAGFFHLHGDLGPVSDEEARDGWREGEGGKRVMEEVEEEVEEQHAATSSSSWARSRRRIGSTHSPSSSPSSSSSSSATEGLIDKGGEEDGRKGLYTPRQHLKASDDLLRAFPSITEQTPPPSPRLQDDEDKRNQQGGNNFTINLGRALDHLRVDVPLLFDREPDLSIYTEDVRLRDEARVYASGKFVYQMVYFSLRLAKVFMPMPPLVEVLNIRWCPARQSIEVRFQIRVDTLSDSLYFDAVSVYRVNAKGLIYEHLIEKIIRNDLSEKPSMVSLFYATRQVLIGGNQPIPDSVGM